MLLQFIENMVWRGGKEGSLMKEGKDGIKLPLFSGNDDTDCTVLNTHFILKGASTDTDTNTR